MEVLFIFSPNFNIGFYQDGAQSSVRHSLFPEKKEKLVENLEVEVTQPYVSLEEKNNQLINLFGIKTLPNEKIPVKNIQEKIKQLDAEKRNYKQKDGVLIYDTKHNKEHFNFNLKVHNNKHKLIGCREFSHLVAEKNIKNYHSMFQSATSITKIDSLMKNVFDENKTHYHFSYYSYVPSSSLFEYLHDILKLLQSNQQCNLLLNTENHVMAINLQHRQSCTEEDIHIIKLYDPNNTAEHTRMLIEKLESIKDIHVADWLTKRHIEFYMPFYKCFLVSSVKSLLEHEKPYVEGGEDNFSSQLYFFMRFGLSEKIEDCIENILNTEINHAEKIILLSAFSHHKTPAFHLAMQEGHTQAVLCYAKKILCSTLANKDKIFLLQSLNKHGCSALYIAMQEDCIEAVKAYMNSVLESNLTSDEKFELVYALANDISGLYLAMQEGHSKVVVAYVKILLNSDFDEDKKTMLLTTKLKNYKKTKLVAAIYIALRKGYDEVVEQYFDLIAHSMLSEKNKAVLLSVDEKLIEKIFETRDLPEDKFTFLFEYSSIIKDASFLKPNKTPARSHF